MLHLSFDKLPKLLHLLWYNVEEKLVVNLKRHLRLELAIADKLIDLQHRQLDKVRSRSLERSIDRSALRKAAHARISRPSAVRTGMFCRLGLVEDRRPVAVPTWLKVVWTRPWLSVS